MSASRDARHADLSELLPLADAATVDAAVDAWCSFFSERTDPSDVDPATVRAFLTRFDQGNESSAARLT